MVERNSIGAIRSRGRCYRTGLSRGSADLVCVVAGRFAALEVKTPGEVPSRPRVAECVAKLGAIAVEWWRQHGVASVVATWAKQVRALPEAERHVLEQEAWQERVRKFGGFACYVDSVESARAAVVRCRAGECS
jgi:hypothetical protein